MSIPGVQLDAALVETNIVRFTVEQKLMKNLKIDYFGIKDKMKEEHKILCNAGFHNDNIRFVTHRDVNRQDCENALKAIRQILTPVAPITPAKASPNKTAKDSKKAAQDSSSSSSSDVEKESKKAT